MNKRVGELRARLEEQRQRFEERKKGPKEIIMLKEAIARQHARIFNS